MANTASYPIIVPKVGDLIVGTQTYTASDPVLDNPTRNFTVGSLVNLIPSIVPGGGTVTLVNFTSNIAAFSPTVVNGSTTPALSLNLNGGSAGQFLRQDGNWAVVPATGITSQQANEIIANNAKVGITTGQASGIVTNSSKISYTAAAAVAANTAKVGYTEALVSANTQVAANTAKNSITSAQSTAITVNTSKVGYTEAAVSANTSVYANTLKYSYPTADSNKLAGVQALANVNTINSSVTGEPTGSDVVLNIVSLTQAEYDAGTPVSTTFYVIT
jgi:hypothetical protein